MINVADGGRVALLLLPRTSVTNHQNGRPERAVDRSARRRRKRPDAGRVRRDVGRPARVATWRPFAATFRRPTIAVKTRVDDEQSALFLDLMRRHTDVSFGLVTRPGHQLQGGQLALHLDPAD